MRLFYDSKLNPLNSVRVKIPLARQQRKLLNSFSFIALETITSSFNGVEMMML